MEFQQGQNYMYCISLCYGEKLYTICIIFRCAVYTFHGVTVGSMLWGKMYMWHIIYAHLCYYSTFWKVRIIMV